MLERIRRLLRPPPLAAPGRTSLWRRFAPELCALAVYLALPFMISPSWTLQLIAKGGFWPPHWLWYRPDTAIRALKVTGPLMVLLAVWLFAPAVARERELGTLESFLLTPRHGRALTARFLRGLWPLLRLTAYLAPVYLLTARPNNYGWLFSFGASGWSIGHLSLLCLLTPLGWSGAAGKWSTPSDPRFRPWGLAADGCGYAGLRLLNDVTAMLLAAALAWHFSTRSRSGARAAALALAGTGLLLVTVLSPDVWWLALHMTVESPPPSVPLRGAFDFYWTDNTDPFVTSYWAVTASTAAVRLGLAALLVRRSIRGFDRRAFR